MAEYLSKDTRRQVPQFISETVSVSPWIDSKYKSVWPCLHLESWDDVFDRTGKTLVHLLRQCYGKGDLIILSHRSTLQSVFAHLCPQYRGDTKLEYGAVTTIVEDVSQRGKFCVLAHNQVSHLRYLIKSPASNPFRHIEGYYKDLDWSKYKSSRHLASATQKEVNSTDGKEKEQSTGPPSGSQPVSQFLEQLFNDVSFTKYPTLFELHNTT